MAAFIRVTTATGPALIAVDQIAAVVTEIGFDNIGTEESKVKNRSAIWLKGGRTVRPMHSVATVLKRIGEAS